VFVERLLDVAPSAGLCRTAGSADDTGLLSNVDVLTCCVNHHFYIFPAESIILPASNM